MFEKSSQLSQGWWAHCHLDQVCWRESGDVQLGCLWSAFWGRPSSLVSFAVGGGMKNSLEKEEGQLTSVPQCQW